MLSLSYYKNHTIEDWGGVISEDFKKFASAYRRHLNSMCKKNSWKVVNFSRGHYYCSWFIENSEGKFIYMSFSDCRYFSKDWYNSVLYRTAKSDHDYTGGSNWYTDLSSMEMDLRRMFERM